MMLRYLITGAILVLVRPLTAQQATPANPFEPLTSEEITSAVRILRAQGKASDATRYTTITLEEPAKDAILAGTGPFHRAASIVAYEYSGNKSFEGVVDLTSGTISSWREVPGVQAQALADDVEQLNSVLRADARWRSLMESRGKKVDSVVAFPYPIGPFAPAGEPGRLFLARGEGAMAYVNITTRKVLRVIDLGKERLNPSSFQPDSLGPARTGMHPVQTTQIGGPGFILSGHDVRWQNWHFRFGIKPREGLVLYTVGYQDEARERSILYRGSLSELFVPYGDRGEGSFFLNAFDAGEAGLGSYGDVTMTPADCPANAVFSGAVLHDYTGKPRDIPRAACLYERDGGVLWRHGKEVRRAQDLVLSSIVRVDNYDYGFNWIFHQDGALELEVMLTGIMNVRGLPDAAAESGADHYATIIEHRMEAMNHQHLFNFRLDMDVDGPLNSLVEMNVEAPPVGPRNPNGNALVERDTTFRRERDARRMLNLATARKWRVVSDRDNALGQPTGYVLVPGENSLAYQTPGTVLRKRAGFVDAHLWVTPYSPDEMWAAGSFVYGSKGGDGLPAWTAANRSIANTDLVLWYTLGVTHIPRPEDWPVMPAHRTGFKLVPTGFFTRNAALDVPKPAEVR